MNTPSAICLFILSQILLGCGSPLLDHEVRTKPKAATEIPAPSRQEPEALESRTAVALHRCDVRSQPSDICIEFDFLENPQVMGVIKGFEADLTFFDESTNDLIEIKKLTRIIQRGEAQCCMPPPLTFKQTGPGQYRVSQIEFHLPSRFKFLVEFEGPDSQAERAIFEIEVSE
jgi:hypothetical protein